MQYVLPSGSSKQPPNVLWQPCGKCTPKSPVRYTLVQGWQLTEVCQVDTHRFVRIQVPSYELVVYYEWIYGKGNIFFLLSCWSTSITPPINRSGRTLANFFTPHRLQISSAFFKPFNDGKRLVTTVKLGETTNRLLSKDIQGNNTTSETTAQQHEEKMPSGTTSQDTDFCQMSVSDCCFSKGFYWHETDERNPDLDNLQKGLHMPSCSASNVENPDVAGFNKLVWASFVSVLTCVHHS